MPALDRPLSNDCRYVFGARTDYNDSQLEEWTNIVVRVFAPFYAVFASFYAVFASFYAVFASFCAVFVSLCAVLVPFYAVFVLKVIALQGPAAPRHQGQVG